jgi:hypothetical protein
MLLLGHLFKSQKDIWDIVQVVSAMSIPIVIGFGSYWIQKSIAKESVAKDYVGIATTILEKPKQEGADDLREWARKLLVRYSPEPFSPQAQEQLQNRGLSQYSPPRSRSPDGTKEAITRQSPGGYWYVSVIDPRTGRETGLGLGPAGWSRLVWSPDGSKLLVCWENEGRVAGFNFPKETDITGAIPQHKPLGEYQALAPDSRPIGIKSLNFSEDGRSIIMELADGEYKVWQLP